MSYPVLAPVSEGYPKVKGRLLTCYSPVRRSSTPKGLSARLACVKHAASVRPEPGSNSPSRSHDTHPTGRAPNLKTKQSQQESLLQKGTKTNQTQKKTPEPS